SVDRFLFGRAERDPTGGDLGGAYQTRPTLGFDGSMARNPTDRGRQALSYFLAETDPGIQHHDGEEPQIRSDEFELIDHGGNAYTVVLPGVTDLKRPSVGMDPDTNTVRDLDGFSIRSWLDTSKEANYYALMVEQGLVSAGVPLGAELIIVGHSFGADTALDLAADRAFNGGTYDVTHVIAAGYHSQPQLEYVPDGTRVLVLQNRNDMAVKAESVLDRITFDSPTKHDHDAIVDVFDGGFSGAGHHQRHYVDHIEASDDASVGRFLASLDARGHTRPGSSLAVDVSVPMSSPKPDL
ncbi:MAG: hypothetical protein GY773_24345, partial [Actinomycetia bacterium]|nr:hypothetical protein [Actinomycetes bacterium]